MMQQPETRFVKSGDLHIAYQVLGDGPIDLIYSSGIISHLDLIWEQPQAARYLRRLASFSRLILFDQRGVGLSDAPPTLGSLEDHIDDILAVMRTVGSERAALFGSTDGCLTTAVFAATHPSRTQALIWYGSGARARVAPDHPHGVSDETWESIRETTRKFVEEGTITASQRFVAPSTTGDERMSAWWRRFSRGRASPSRLLASLDWLGEQDVRDVLPTIQVPTLVIRRVDDTLVTPGAARDVAERIKSARYVEVPGSDHIPWIGDYEAIADEIEEFLTGTRHRLEPDRVLATVLFVDIVGSTQHAAQLGDRRWRDLLELFYESVRRQLESYRGREVKTIGDAVLATFDGPARGIRCAQSIATEAHGLGVDVRAGLHTGECEIMGDDVGGIAVHIGARVSNLAQPGEVLVSSTVKDLVVGSGIEFADRGTHGLKGVPGEWRLFAVQN